MFLFNLFILLQALSIALSADVESEDILKIEDLFKALPDNLVKSMEKKNSPKNFVKPLDKTSLHQNTVTSPEKDNIPKNPKGSTSQTSKAKHPKKFNPSSIKTLNRTNELNEYIEHIKKKGVSTLKEVEKIIVKKLKLKKNIIQINTKNYVMEVQNYFDSTTAQKAGVICGAEILFIDLSEVASRLLYREQQKILNDTVIALNISDPNVDSTVDYHFSIEHNSTVSPSDVIKAGINKLSQIINKDSTDIRKDEMKYICSKYKVCRPYPSFTDYCGFYISEILKLPRKKFEVFVKLLSMIVTINEDFAYMVSKVKDSKPVIEVMMGVSNNVTKLKQSLEMLQAVFTQKFNIIHNPEFQPKMVTPAVRILLDIVDKSFQHEYYAMFLGDFETSIKIIRDWVKDKVSSISTALSSFIDSVLKTVTKILRSNKDNMKRVIILIEMIYGGEPIHEEYYATLFKQDVKDEDFKPILDNLSFVKM